MRRFCFYRCDDNVRLRGNHEETDTRLILHSCEAANGGYESGHMQGHMCHAAYGALHTHKNS